MSRRRIHVEPVVPAAGDLPAWLAMLVLAIAVCLVYAASLDSPLIFDDLPGIEDNASIKRLWPLFGDAQHPGPLRPPTELPTSARPLVNLTFAMNYYFGGFAPVGYHLVNTALHFLAALLLWAIVRRSLRLACFAGKYDRVSGQLALCVALLWAVHPLLTEAVVYVTQRTELMVVLFYLAALYASLRYWDAESTASRRAWLALATVAGFAGAASKEVMVTAPVVLLLFEWTFIGGSLREILRRSWPLYLGLALSWILIVWLHLDSPRSRSAGFGLGQPVIDWWSTQAYVFWMYLKLAVYPAPLVVHYSLPTEPLSVHWLSVVAVVALGILSLVLLLRRQPAGFLLSAIMLVLAPTHLVPIPTEMAAERRMYLPLALLVALTVVGMYWLMAQVAAPNTQGDSAARNQRFLKRIGVSAVAILAVFYASTSLSRIALYRQPVKLWQDAVERYPDNPMTQLNYATSLAEALRLEESIEHFRLALRYEPDNTKALYGLGLALANLGQLDESIVVLRKFVKLKPHAARLRNNLGVVLFTAERYPEAIAEFEIALEIEPGFHDARDNLERARHAKSRPAKVE